MVNSQLNNKLVNFKNQSNNVLSIFLLCNAFFDLQNLHSTRIRASIDDIGLYKYSLIKITANFIDHLLSDSRMTPVTIGQINLRKSVLSAPGHERPWPTEKRSEGRTTPSPLFNCLSKSPISKTRSDHYNGAL